MTSFIIILFMLIYTWYVIIIRKKNQVLEALSGIDVQLSKRHDLIPNILKIAQNFMNHEKNLILEVTNLRAKIPQNYQHDNDQEISEYFKLNNEIAQKMTQLLLQVENYPNLKSDQTMLQAQNTYNEVEEHVSAARRFYNSAVAELNNVIQVFPGNLIVKLTTAKIMPFYQADPNQAQAIDASDFLKN